MARSKLTDQDKAESLERARASAKRRGGECLSTDYVNFKTHLLWRCAEGHEWGAGLGMVDGKAQSWCPRCGGTVKDPVEQLKRAQDQAAANGGKCLSTEYVTAKGLLRWQCKYGHEWEADFNGVLGPLKRWCPECGAGKTERMVKAVVEDLFGMKFVKIRPSWLMNPETGYPLEIDIYNDQLKIGIEYHGEQHFRQLSFKNRQDVSLEYQQRKDQLKKQLAHAHGVQLIEIPFNVRADELAWWIYGALHFRNNEHAQQLSKLVEDRWKVVKPRDFVNVEDPIRIAQDLAESKGGKFLSTDYIGARMKHQWQCAKGHTWMAQYASVVGKNQTWCAACEGLSVNSEDRLKIAQERAESMGGKCLSLVYVGARANLHWCCKHGHEWKATYDSVVGKKSWCLKCVRKHKYKVPETSIHQDATTDSR